MTAHPCTWDTQLSVISVHFSVIWNLTWRFSDLSFEEMKEPALVRLCLCSRLSVTFIRCTLLILLDCHNFIKHHKANLTSSSAKTLYLYTMSLCRTATSDKCRGVLEPPQGWNHQCAHMRLTVWLPVPQPDSQKNVWQTDGIGRLRHPHRWDNTMMAIFET